MSARVPRAFRVAGPPSCRRRIAAVFLAVVILGTTTAAADAPASVLRVCADPNNMPFSDAAGRGFENELARLLAKELGRDVAYTWWPQRRGFIRNTLKAGRCDVVMGLPVGFEMAALTQPYYASSYVFVTRRGAGFDRLSGLDDARLRRARIGLHTIGDDYANVPPAQELARLGLGGNVVGYPIYGDYSKPSPPSELIAAVAKGDVDVAVAWGPLAGYYAARSRPELAVTPIRHRRDGAAAAPLEYAIAIGVRRDDLALKQSLERAVVHDREAIARLLDRFDVPRIPLPLRTTLRNDAD